MKRWEGDAASLNAGCLVGCRAAVAEVRGRRTCRLRGKFLDEKMLIVSIILEAAVAVIAMLAARQGRPYLYGLAFTFAAYVLYDVARLLQWPVEGALLSGLFLVATVTALIAVWALYREGGKR